MQSSEKIPDNLPATSSTTQPNSQERPEIKPGLLEGMIKELKIELKSVQERLHLEEFKNDALSQELSIQQLERIDLRVKNKQLNQMLDRAELLYEHLREKMQMEGVSSTNVKVYELVQREWNDIMADRPKALPKTSPIALQESWD